MTTRNSSLAYVPLCACCFLVSCSWFFASAPPPTRNNRVRGCRTRSAVRRCSGVLVRSCGSVCNKPPTRTFQLVREFSTGPRPVFNWSERFVHPIPSPLVDPSPCTVDSTFAPPLWIKFVSEVGLFPSPPRAKLLVTLGRQQGAHGFSGASDGQARAQSGATLQGHHKRGADMCSDAEWHHRFHNATERC